MLGKAVKYPFNMNGKINQAIICINDTKAYPPIKKGLKYVINDIHTCPTCGTVEFKLSIPSDGLQNCVSCDRPFEDNLCDTWWAEHWRFAPLESNEAKNKDLNVKLEPNKVIKELNVISN